MKFLKVIPGDTFRKVLGGTARDISDTSTPWEIDKLLDEFFVDLLEEFPLKFLQKITVELLWQYPAELIQALLVELMLKYTMKLLQRFIVSPELLRNFWYLREDFPLNFL